jgi:quercetin dioxygenase-like cupin family protein
MSAIHHFIGKENGYDWEKVILKEFSDGNSKGASGKVIIGEKDNAPYFVFRYVRIEPGGYSTLNDYHAHDHGIYILHGRAMVNIEGTDYEVGPRDMIYISPLEHHYLRSIGEESLGFLCVIPNKEMLKKLSAVV